MTEASGPNVVATLEDDSGDFCVDILQHPDGLFTYVEFARDAEDDTAWHIREDQSKETFKSEFAAYTAAMRNVVWLMG